MTIARESSGAEGGNGSVVDKAAACGEGRLFAIANQFDADEKSIR